MLKEYTIESTEPYNSTVSGFTAMLKRLPGVIIDGAVDFSLEIESDQPQPAKP
jgi:hypothetical protein